MLWLVIPSRGSGVEHLLASPDTCTRGQIPDELVSLVLGMTQLIAGGLVSLVLRIAQDPRQQQFSDLGLTSHLASPLQNQRVGSGLWL